MISFEKLSREEKKKLTSILRKKLFIRNILYLIVILGSLSVLVYFNYSVSITDFENTGLINIAFLITLFLTGRICVMDFFEYLKEVRSPVKKIVLTKILKRDGDVLTIGNQQFSKEDILLDSSEFDLLHSGDNVLVEHSEKSHMIFNVKKI